MRAWAEMALLIGRRTAVVGVVGLLMPRLADLHGGRTASVIACALVTLGALERFAERPPRAGLTSGDAR